MMAGNNGMILPTVVAMIALCLFIALINAVVTIKLRVPSFLTTLGMLYILQGLALIITNKPAGLAAPAFAEIASINWGGLPMGVVAAAVIVIVAGLVLQGTVFGRHVYAVGGDAEVARLSGIKVNRVKIETFLACGLFTALAGLYVAARTTVGDPNVGSGYELASIAAVVIGGTSLFGGRGGLTGTVAGVLILTALTNVLNLNDIDSYTQLMIRGGIIIAVVASYTRRK
jgi:ribose transport system permease protein